MSCTSKLRRFLLDRSRRILLAAAGLMVFALGAYLQLQADIGLSPWFALNQGLSRTFPISYGNASIVVSFLVLAADLILREPIGIGTILDILVVGWGTDFFLSLELVPVQTRFAVQLSLLLAGLVACALGQYLYMKAALSCGPRDALMVALGRRVTRVSIGTVNILLSLAVLTAGTLLGSRVGPGTLIGLFGTGVVMDLVFHLLRFEPRTVVNEGAAQTWSAFTAAWRTDQGE